MLDRLEAIPTGRHAHIDDRHRIGASLLERGRRLLDAFPALVGRVDLELRTNALRRGFAKKARLEDAERVLGGVLGVRSQHLAKIGMNRRVVVDDEDAPIHGG